jgi:hypothetical protein
MTSSQDTVERLFDEFIDARRGGEHPDVVAFLERAGAQRDVLGRMIDAYLVAAPVAPPDEETIVLLSARLAGRTAMAELRERRALSVASVVERLRETLGLAGSLTTRLTEAYEDLERDWLDPRGVQPPVWTALKSTFALDVRRLVSIEAHPPVAAVLMRREPLDASMAPARPERGPRDEVDELFRGPPIE